jgi:hypothetical protein
MIINIMSSVDLLWEMVQDMGVKRVNNPWATLSIEIVEKILLSLPKRYWWKITLLNRSWRDIAHRNLRSWMIGMICESKEGIHPSIARISLWRNGIPGFHEHISSIIREKAPQMLPSYYNWYESRKKRVIQKNYYSETFRLVHDEMYPHPRETERILHLEKLIQSLSHRKRNKAVSNTIEAYKDRIEHIKLSITA